MQSSALTLESIQQARTRLTGGVRLTPCAFSAPLSELAGMIIFCKRDFEQFTGSFKERGARNALLALSPEHRRAGVVAASAGNHALGLARHGNLLGIEVTVVMPTTAPLVKVHRCRGLGARVVLRGSHFEQASAYARELAERENLTFIHPFDDVNVIAGQGTLALEVLEQVPDLDAFVVPVGGGGLLAGVATVIKTLRPEVEVIAAEPTHAASFAVSFDAGHTVRVPVGPTLADGLAVARVGENAFSFGAPLVDRAVTVTEDDIAVALLEIAERENLSVEGAGAVALAACLSGKLDHLRGKRVVIPLCGRNIDPDTQQQAFWRGWTARESAREKTFCSPNALHH